MIGLRQKSAKQNLHHRQTFSHFFDAMNLSHCDRRLVTDNQQHYAHTNIYLHIQHYTGATKARPSIPRKHRIHLVEGERNARTAFPCDSYGQQQQMQYYPAAGTHCAQLLHFSLVHQHGCLAMECDAQCCGSLLPGFTIHLHRKTFQQLQLDLLCLTKPNRFRDANLKLCHMK